jgi:nitrate reductase gamma subunit
MMSSAGSKQYQEIAAGYAGGVVDVTAACMLLEHRLAESNM